jgi:DNA-binding response OmpR family regulator
MHRAKILVADDSCTIRTIVRRALAKHDFDVTLACDGLEAVHLAHSTRPDLVILDIQMPEMDGYAACEQILASEDRSPTLQILFLTKESAGHLSVLGHQFGAYLQKPICEETLMATVHNLLQIQFQTHICQAAS